MATYALWSGAGGAADGSSWADAYTTLAALLARPIAAGDDIAAAQDHSESTDAATTWTFPGTAAAPNRLLCCNRAGSFPPVSADLTTGAIIATGSGSTRTLNLLAHAYIEGCTLRAGVGGSSSGSNINLLASAAGQLTFKNCVLEVATTGAGAGINIGGAGSAIATQGIRWINTQVKFAATGHSIACFLPLVWEFTPSAIQGTVPTTLFGAAAEPRPVICRGVDLSAAGSGKNWCSLASASPGGSFLFHDCKAGASVAYSTGSVVGPGGSTIRVVNSDSADTTNNYYSKTYAGEEFSETVILMTTPAGATNGTQAFSRKLVSTANAKFLPGWILEGDWLPIWNDTVGSITVTVPIVTDNVTLKDNEAYLDIMELGTSGFPLGVNQNDGAPDVLNAGTNQTTDTSTWTTTGITTPVYQKLAKTFTPTGKGIIFARVMLAKASTTLWYDPKAQVA